MFKVSVIIPVYNTEKYLDDCLKSVVNQTLKEIEIILVNDGSTDSSLEIMERYKEEYPDRIQLISKENGGQATARNMAIPMCRGEYIGFVDSDDYIEPTMYERMYEKATGVSADYVECDYVNVKINDKGEQERIADYGSRVREYSSKKDMFIDPMLAPWNKMYRRELLQKSTVIFPEGLIYEDTAFCLKAISLVDAYAYVPEKFVVHFYRGGSTMNINKSYKVADIFKVLKDVTDYYKQNDIFDEYKDELEYIITKILLCSSMKRIAEIPDRNLRKRFSVETWEMIQEYFPNYKSNKYVRGKENILRYMRCVSRWNIGLFCEIFAWRKEKE